MPKKDLILLALDESHTLKLMDRALQAVNYETAIASDTKALSRLLQETTPALLMVGESFDGYDGLVVVEELLERFPTLPFLIYTEKARPEFVRRVFRLGINGYLAPPLKTDDIVGTVEGALKHAYRVGDWLRREVKRTTTSLKKRAQISESERSRLETVINSIHDNVMILDQDNLVLLINPAMCSSFGLDEKSSIGKPVFDLIQHPDLRALISNNGNHDPLAHHEVNFPDGRVASAQLTEIPEIGYAVTMQDITYLKEVDRIRNEVVHTVSHDLRSPLTAILGYAELIERIGPLSEMQREFLHRVQISVHNITSLVDDLLNLGRIEAGFDSRKERVALDQLIRFSVDNLSRRSQEKNQTVSLDLSTDFPLIFANPVQIRSVVDNLIDNAIKYTPNPGIIRIRCAVEQNQVIFQVTDSGIGIPATDLPYIFDKFYRASNVNADQPGTGLGLAIVKSIVENHQGRIWVDSTPEQGSTFTVVFPLAEDR